MADNDQRAAQDARASVVVVAGAADGDDAVTDPRVAPAVLSPLHDADYETDDGDADNFGDDESHNKPGAPRKSAVKLLREQSEVIDAFEADKKAKQRASAIVDETSEDISRVATADGDDIQEAGDEVVQQELLDDLQNTLDLMAGTADTALELEMIGDAFAEGADAPSQGTGGLDEFAANRLRSEYDKLHRLFTQSRKNEASLMKKCKDLSTELTANAAKVQAALKLSQNDRSTIASLKKEVKKAWKMVEVGSEKDNRSKDIIARLKLEVEQLRKGMGVDDGEKDPTNVTLLINSSGGGHTKMVETQIQQEETINKLTKAKESLTAQLEIASSDAKVLQMETEELNNKITALLAERVQVESDSATLKELLAAKKSEQDREIRAREKVEATVRALMDSATKRDQDLITRVNEIKILKDALAKSEAHVTAEKAKMTAEIREREALNARMHKMQTELDEQEMVTLRLRTENQNQAVELKGWDEELSRYKEEWKTMARMKESLLKRSKVLEEGKNEAEVERDNLRAINASLTHSLETIRHELDTCHKQIENLTRERDITQKNFVKATGATQKQLNAVKLAEQTKRNLEQEIHGYKEEAGKMRKLIYSLEKDRDRHINEAGKIGMELVTREEDIKMKEMMIFDSRKKIADLEKKLKEQQALYENVRADRNLYSKNLIESQDEITEMKRKVKIMSHQIEQLKEEIANKESTLVKEHFEHSKLEKEKEGLLAQIAKLMQTLEEAQQQIQNQKSEENKLKHIIAEADAERVKQRKEYDTVVQERDILGTQLIRRNDEISLLYEKIKIQTSTLNKGEIQYRERLEDIRVLKLEIKKLRREKAILQTETQNVEGLRNEIFRLQREVLRERTRVKVLEEELESPMNIHRWRKLSGSDPSTYELITKIQTLQKRLIAKTEEVVEKDLIIGQKEKLYAEIKDVLQRQPGPEIVEELRVVKEAVKTKIRECKSLASELNMYHSQVNEYKYEIDRLNRELQALKRKYFEQRKKDRERLRHPGGGETMRLASVHPPPGVVSERVTENYVASSNGGGSVGLRPNPPLGPKFSGGGFNMSAAPAAANAATVVRGVVTPTAPPGTQGGGDLQQRAAAALTAEFESISQVV